MSETQEYLKIVKHDGRVHLCPSTQQNIKTLNHQNSLKAPEKRSRITQVELTDEEYKTQPPVEHNHSGMPSGSDAKSALLKKEKESLEKQVARLKAELAEAKGSESSNNSSTPKTVADIVALIEGATSEEEVNTIVGDDTRTKVTKAADKRKEELTRL